MSTRSRRSVLLVAIGIGLTGVAAAPPARAQSPDAVLATADLKSVADAFVSSAQPDRNFGGENRLWVGDRPGYGATRTAVRWDHTDLDKDRAVTDAEVRLYLSQAGPSGDPGRDIVLFRIDGGWDEGNIAWNRWPSVRSDRLAVTRVGGGSGWQSFRSAELTKRVKAWRLPGWQRAHTANRGLYVQGYETAGSNRGFDAREGSNDPILRLTHVDDVKPPTSALEPLPLYHTTPDRDQPGSSRIALEWDYDDPEPATGVEFFRIYAQLAQGDWQLVADKVERTDATVLGINGGRYKFAIYAVDQAGNIEVPGPAEAETLVDLTPPYVSIEALPEWSGAAIQVAWSGKDYPEGPGLEPSGIATYDAFYAIDGGPWLTLALGTTARTAVLDAPYDGATYTFMARASDRAGNFQPIGEAQTVTRIDRRPPTVTMQRIAGGEDGLFTVRWEGDDHGGSGVTTYDVQYRVDSGPWMNWVLATRDLERIFQGERPHFYAFRARARDAAGNEAPWPAEPLLRVAIVGPGDLPNTVQLPWAAR